MSTSKPKVHRWDDVKHRGRAAEKVAPLERRVEQALVAMDLREIRELTGKTQAELADAAEMTQSEVSRLEHRDDHRLSTLRRVVQALGGELEVTASFGDRRVRLRALG